jgi:hypothetical protein
MHTNRENLAMRPLHYVLFVLLTIAIYTVAGARASELDPLPELVDHVKVGDAHSERDHNLQGDNTHTGHDHGRTWRHANDRGWFTYDLKVDAKTPLSLQCDYWGGEVDRSFDLLVDGEHIADVRLDNPHPGQFFTIIYPLQGSIVKGKRRIVVCFRPHSGSIAGGLYGIEIRRRKQ